MIKFNNRLQSVLLKTCARNWRQENIKNKLTIYKRKVTLVKPPPQYGKLKPEEEGFL
jgi:hypothetical protein